MISEILEMCGYNKQAVLDLVSELQDLCDRTNDNFEEDFEEEF